MQHRKPAWWQLALLIPIMFGLMALDHVFPLASISDGNVDAGILILTFVAMLVWLNKNGGRLEWYYVDKDRALDNLKITVYEPVSKMQSADMQPEDSTPALRTNGDDRTTLALPFGGSTHQPVRVFRPQPAHRKDKSKWFRS